MGDLLSPALAMIDLVKGEPWVDLAGPSGFIDRTNESQTGFGLSRALSSPRSPFDRVPNELLLRIITIAAEDNPPSYHGPDARRKPTLGPRASFASQVCRLWFDATRFSKSTRHLWHFGVSLDWTDRRAAIDLLAPFQRRLSRSRGCDIYVFFSGGRYSINNLPTVHVAAVSLQILHRYRHQLASMTFNYSFSFMASFLSNFIADCERLHTIVVGGPVSQNADGDLSCLYVWAGSHAPFSSLTHLYILPQGGVLDLSPMPLGPNIKNVVIKRRSQHAKDLIKMTGATLVSLVLTHPRLEELDLDFELDDAPVTHPSSMARYHSKLKTLFLYSGSVIPTFLLSNFRLDDLGTMELRQRTSQRHIKHEAPGIPIPSDSIPSLRRAVVSNPSLWECVAALFATRKLEYLEIGDISSTSGSPPFSAARRLTLKISLNPRDMVQEAIFIRQFRLPTLETTEFLDVILSCNALAPADRDVMVPGCPRASVQPPRTIAPLLLMVEITLQILSYDENLAVFQYLLNGIDARSLRTVSLSFSEGPIWSSTDFKMIISAHQITHNGARCPGTTLPLRHSSPCKFRSHPDLGLQSASSFDIQLECYDSWYTMNTSSEVHTHAFRLLGSIGADDGVALAGSIHLLTILFPNLSWADIPVVGASKFVEGLQSAIMAKMDVGRPIQRVVIMDENGTLDWDVPMMGEESANGEIAGDESAENSDSEYM